MTGNKIRVLETIRQGSIGGGETYLMNLVLNLDKAKFEPAVLAFTDGEMIARLRGEGIECHVIPTETPFDICVYGKVMQLIDTFSPDIVHFHGSRAGTNTLIPARLKRKPVLYTVHGWSFHTGTSASVQKGRILAEKFLVKYSNVTVCGSAADITNGKRLLGVDKFRLIHNSIDSAKFLPAEKDNKVLTDFGLSESDFIVCSMARVTYQKDPLTFIRAAKLVHGSHPGIRFLMIGDGDMKEQALAEARKLEMENVILFSRFRTDVREVLSSIDVFVLPSLWEVIPLALLEAMSMEKICVATEIEGTCEALHHEENGLLFTPGNPEALAEQIIRAYGDASLSGKMKKNARKTVVDHFDIRRLVQKNEELYTEIYSKARP